MTPRDVAVCLFWGLVTTLVLIVGAQFWLGWR